MERTERFVGVRSGVASEVMELTRNSVLKELDAGLQKRPVKYGGTITSMLESIYLIYTECNPIEDERVKQADKALHMRLTALTGSMDEADELMNFASEAYSECERVSFMEGMRVGARLILELMKDE